MEGYLRFIPTRLHISSLLLPIIEGTIHTSKRAEGNRFKMLSNPHRHWHLCKRAHNSLPRPHFRRTMFIKRIIPKRESEQCFQSEVRVIAAVVKILVRNPELGQQPFESLVNWAAKNISSEKLGIKDEDIGEVRRGPWPPGYLFQACNVAIDAVAYQDGVSRLLVRGIWMASEEDFLEK